MSFGQGRRTFNPGRARYGRSNPAASVPRGPPDTTTTRRRLRRRARRARVARPRHPLSSRNSTRLPVGRPLDRFLQAAIRYRAFSCRTFHQSLQGQYADARPARDLAVERRRLDHVELPVCQIERGRAGSRTRRQARRQRRRRPRDEAGRVSVPCPSSDSRTTSSGGAFTALPKRRAGTVCGR